MTSSAASSQQNALRGPHQQHGIATQAWSPIGGITSYVPGRKSALQDPTLSDIARRRDEIAKIDALDTGVRGGPEPDNVTLEKYGKTIPEA